MPVSRNRNKHKEKSKTYKNKRKKMNNQSAMPPVRNVPIWAPDAKIEVTGYEWEAINDGIGQMSLAIQAIQAVMSRNIVNGNIQMDFEKLNPLSMQYEPMAEDEKVKYRADFAAVLKGFKDNQAKEQVAEKEPVTQQESLLVDSSGAKIQSEEPTKEQAKVVNMFATDTGTNVPPDSGIVS